MGRLFDFGEVDLYLIITVDTVKTRVMGFVVIVFVLNFHLFRFNIKWGIQE